MLSDAHKRALYDRGGERAMKEGGLGGRGGGSGFGSPMDIFDLFFGGGVRMRNRADRRGRGIRDSPGPRGGRGHGAHSGGDKPAGTCWWEGDGAQHSTGLGDKGPLGAIMWERAGAQMQCNIGLGGHRLAGILMCQWAGAQHRG